MCSNAAIVICSFKEKDSKTAVSLIWKAGHKYMFEMKCLYISNLMVNTFQSLFIVRVENKNMNKRKGVCAGGGHHF